MASDAEIDLLVNASNALRDLEGDLDRLVNQAEASADPVLIAATLDRTLALRNMRRELDDAIRVAQADADPIRVDVDIDDDEINRVSNLRILLGGLGDSAGRALGPLAGLAASVGTAGAAAGVAVPLLAGLAVATESIIPAAAVAASGILALQAASLTLKVAMVGVEDAISTAFDPDADPEELAKAMEKLAPEARDFAQSLVDIRGPLRQIQQNVQNEVFRNFGDVIDRLAKNVLPSLGVTAGVIGEQLNEMGHQAATAATEFLESGSFTKAINGSVTALRNLERVPAQAVTAFGQLATAATPAFTRITSAAGKAFDKISAKLTESFESGELEQAIDAAVDNIAQLGRIAGNIFSGLGNIIDAVSVDGEGLFKVLETLSQAFEDLTASKEFQTALGELSKTMGLVAQTIAPLLIQAFKIIAEVVTALAPSFRELVTVVGDALGKVLDALGPVLISLAENFAKLIPVLTPFVELAGTLIAAILPALIPLFDALGQIFEALAPFAQQLAANLATQLVPILEAIGPVLSAILPPFVQIIEQIFPILTQLLADLQPSLALLATTFADLLVELAPVIGELLSLVAVILQDLTPIIQPLLRLLTDLIQLGMEALAGIIHEVVVPALQILVDLLNGDVEGAFNKFKDTGANVVADTIISFQTMRDRIVNFLHDLVIQLPGRAREAMDGLIESFKTGASNALEVIRGIPEDIARSFLGLPGKLFEIGGNIIQGLIDGIAGQISHLQSIVSEIGSIVPDTIGSILGIASPSKVMREFGGWIVEGLRQGMDQALPDLENTVRGLAVTIPTTLARSSGGGVTPIRNPGNLSPRPPSFQISIGNHVLNEFVDFRLHEAQRAAQYRNARGVRR